MTAKRVVVADDSELYLEMLVAALGDVPELSVVGAASNGRDAVRLVVEREADVALLDVEMPLLDGFGAASAIRRLRPHVDLYLHTGSAVESWRAPAARLNVHLCDKLHLARTIDALARRAAA
jgi:DNA-binding NarL/FixJ family response regulator